jgi:hypothetical protein
MCRRWLAHPVFYLGMSPAIAERTQMAPTTAMAVSK